MNRVIPPPRVLLPTLCLVTLGAALGWSWLRASAEVTAEKRPSAPPLPRLADRRPLQPVPGAAAPRPETEAEIPTERGWVELNNEATTDLTAGDLYAAVEKLERCHAAEPESEVFAGNLAEALVRFARAEHEEGRLESAVEHLARAITVGTGRSDIAVLRRILERWRKELELGRDDWTEGSSRFELTYDTDRADILHRSHEVLEHLELSYDDLVRWFGADPLAGGPAVRVVLYDPEDFDRLTGLGDWAAGVFDGVVRVSVRDLARGQAWREVLVHELVHAFVQAAAGPGVPGWLNEGLAQLLEGRPGELARRREQLQGVELFPLERLEGSLAGWQDPAAIARAYTQSLVFVEYLRQTYGDEALRRTLLAIPKGVSPQAAFREWTSVDLEVAFQDWRGGLGR